MTPSRLDPPQVTVRHNASARSYEAIIGAKIAGMIVYERSGDRLVLTHTIIEPEFRGRGIGTALVRGTLDVLLREGLTVTNFCRFVRDFIDAHPEYEAVIDSAHPGIRTTEVNSEVQKSSSLEEPVSDERTSLATSRNSGASTPTTSPPTRAATWPATTNSWHRTSLRRCLTSSSATGRSSSR